MIYAFQLYLITCCLFLAGKDADSYQLKDKTDNAQSFARVKRWHADGLVLYVLYLLPLFVWDSRDWWKLTIAWLLIRLSFFDLPFNEWAGLPVTYIGGTAAADKFFVKIYGTNGAVLKSLTFFGLLVIANILNQVFL